MTPSVNLLIAFLKAVGRLALPPPEQVEYLRASGLVNDADELGLEFDEGFKMVPQFVESEWLATSDADRIKEINDILAAMSGPENAALWTEDALREAPEWQAVRRSARRFLAS
jgi:hypothetical protein